MRRLNCSIIMETITFTTVVQIADCDGQSIKEGSVLRHTQDNCRGVVTKIIRAGDSGPMFSGVGDMAIRESSNCTRMSNNYKMWKHIPHDEQLFEERYYSWLCREPYYDESRSISKDKQLAVDGIMAMLPSDVVDWDYGPFPDTLEDALWYLSKFLSEQK